MAYRYFVFFATTAVITVVMAGLFHFYPLLDVAMANKRGLLVSAMVGTMLAAGADTIGQHMKFKAELAKPHDNWILTGKLIAVVAIILLALSRAGELLVPSA